jgi:hypothetical protein
MEFKEQGGEIQINGLEAAILGLGNVFRRES